MRITRLATAALILLSASLTAQEGMDKMPVIKGGIMELAKNIEYPKSAKDEGIEGTVFITALIDKNGNVESADVNKGVNPKLDAAAVRAVEMTKFIPGVKDGKKVKAKVTIPIKFKLDDCKKKS